MRTYSQREKDCARWVRETFVYPKDEQRIKDEKLAKHSQELTAANKLNDYFSSNFGFTEGDKFERRDREDEERMNRLNDEFFREEN